MTDELTQQTNESTALTGVKIEISEQVTKLISEKDTHLKKHNLIAFKNKLENIKAKQFITSEPNKTRLEKIIGYLNEIIELQQSVKEYQQGNKDDVLGQANFMLEKFDNPKMHQALADFGMLTRELENEIKKDQVLIKKITDIDGTGSLIKSWDHSYTLLNQVTARIPLVLAEYEKNLKKNNLESKDPSILERSRQWVEAIDKCAARLTPDFITAELNEGVTLERFIEIAFIASDILTGLTCRQFFKEVLKIPVSEIEKLSDKPLTFDMLKTFNNIAKHKESLKYLYEEKNIKIGVSDSLLPEKYRAKKVLPIVEILKLNKAYADLVANKSTSQKKKDFIKKFNEKFGDSLDENKLNTAIKQDAVVAFAAVPGGRSSIISKLQESHAEKRSSINEGGINLLKLYNAQLNLEKLWKDIEKQLKNIFNGKEIPSKFDVLPWVRKLLALSAISDIKQRAPAIESILKELPFKPSSAEHKKLANLAKLLTQADALEKEFDGIPLAVIEKKQQLGLLATNLHNNLAFLQLLHKQELLPITLNKTQSASTVSVEELNDEIMPNEHSQKSLEKLLTANFIGADEFQQLEEEIKRQELIQQISDSVVNGTIKQVLSANPEIKVDANLVKGLNSFLLNDIGSLEKFNTHSVKVWLYEITKYKLTELEVATIKQAFQAAVTSFFQHSDYSQTQGKENVEINNEGLGKAISANATLLDKYNKDFKKPIFETTIANFSEEISADMDGIKTVSEQRLELSKLINTLKAVFKDGQLKEFMGISKDTLKSYQELIKKAERKQLVLEKNCLVQFKDRVDYLAKQAEKILPEIDKYLKKNKIDDQRKANKLCQKAESIHKEIQQLREACGRIGTQSNQNDSPMLKDMQRMIEKAEKAAHIELASAGKPETFGLNEKREKLSTKINHSGPSSDKVFELMRTYDKFSEKAIKISDEPYAEVEEKPRVNDTNKQLKN